MPLSEAVRHQVLARCALVGPSGSGKTRGALDMATALVQRYGGKIAGFDTENDRMRLFADRYAFDHDNLTDTSPEGYRDALREAIHGHYTVLVIDSMSPEWKSVLGLADRFGDWKTVRPRHNDFVRDLIEAPLHVIVTMRSKTLYLVEDYDDNGRTRQRVSRLGTGPVQSEGVEYEFDLFGMLDNDHVAEWYNRCDQLVGTRSTPLEAAPVFIDWLEKGDPIPWRAPADLAEAVARMSLFVDDPAPWIKEGVMGAHPAITEWPENFGKLPQEVRADTGKRLAEALRVLEAVDDYDKAGEAQQAIVRDAFSLAFGVEVKGPDPFAAPIPFG